MALTNIEWADKVWNPVTGCTKVSAGCANCYAERIANRFTVYPKSHWFGRKFNDVKIHTERIDQPRRWRKPARIFVNSMSDLFHASVPYEFWRAMVGVAADCERHSFLNLTKRTERMLAFTRDCPPMRNQWMGGSIELKNCLHRLDDIKKVPAFTRFVSFEPLLEDLGEVDLHGIQWIIIGGESGPGARPFNVEWARKLIRQARKAGCAVFVKQMGAKPLLFDDGDGAGGAVYEFPLKLKSRKGSDMSEWPDDLWIREFPSV